LPKNEDGESGGELKGWRTGWQGASKLRRNEGDKSGLEKTIYEIHRRIEYDAASKGGKWPDSDKEAVWWWRSYCSNYPPKLMGE
jgi:hypothetical protein